MYTLWYTKWNTRLNAIIIAYFNLFREYTLEEDVAKKNVVQKILAHAAGRDEVVTGEYVIVRSPRPVTLGGDTMARGPWQMIETGAQKVFDPKMIKIVVGHIGAGGNVVLGTLRKRFREWAERMGIPRENIFDLGQQGVEHIVAGEECWALPGEVYFSVANGHTTSLGASADLQ